MTKPLSVDLRSRGGGGLQLMEGCRAARPRPALG